MEGKRKLNSWKRFPKTRSVDEKIFFQISESVRATVEKCAGQNAMDLGFRVIIFVSGKKFHSLFQSIIITMVGSSYRIFKVKNRSALEINAKAIRASIC